MDSSEVEEFEDRSVTVSAPGKIHLLGEHAVVYGRPALLAAIDKRLYVRIQQSEFSSQNSEEVIIKSEEADKTAKKAISVFKRAYSIKKLSPAKLTITSQIPSRAGLGSSAAVASAVIGALMKSVKNLWNIIRINELAFKVEKIVHGNPSGGDNTVVTFGGFLWFRKEFEFLKSIWQLPFKISPKLASFVLVNSGKPKETTREMVEKVKSEIKNQSVSALTKAEEIFNSQEVLTKQMMLALKNGDEEKLMETIRKGEKNLEKLGVVGSKAISMVHAIEAIGAVAKISGAGGVRGGSGMLLCYHPDYKALVNLVKKEKWEMMQVTLGEEGVRVEKS